MEELITALKEKELLSILTEKQRELYLAMTREGLTLREFARRKGIGIRAASVSYTHLSFELSPHTIAIGPSAPPIMPIQAISFRASGA